MQVGDIASFMSAGHHGGIVLQLPARLSLGYHQAARSVLLMATAGSTLTWACHGLVRRSSSVALNSDRHLPVGRVHAAALFAVGSACQRSRRRGPENMCRSPRALMFFWAIRRLHRPAALPAVLVDWLGASAFFAFICAMHGAFVVIHHCPHHPRRTR